MVGHRAQAIVYAASDSNELQLLWEALLDTKVVVFVTWFGLCDSVQFLREGRPL